MKKTTKIDKPVERGDELFTLDVRDIAPNDFNRKFFDSAKLSELAASMKSSGQWTPVLVRRISEKIVGAGEPGFELVFGERRWRAAMMADMKTLLAIVKPMTRQEAVEACLIENLQREDLQPLEQAEAFEMALREGVAKTQKELARRVGLSESTVSHFMRLLDLPEQGKELVRSGALSYKSAGAVLDLETEKARDEVLDYVAKFKPTAKEVGDFARLKQLDEEREMKWDAQAEMKAKLARESWALLDVEVLRFSDRAKVGERPLDVDDFLPVDAIAPSMRAAYASRDAGGKFLVGTLAEELSVKAVVGSLRPHVPDAFPVVVVDLELLRTAESLLPDSETRWLVADSAAARRDQAADHKKADAKRARRGELMEEELVSAVQRMLLPDHSSDIFRKVLLDWMSVEQEISRMEVVDVLAAALDCQRDDVAHEDDDDWVVFVREQAMASATYSQVVEVLFFIDGLSLLVGMESPNLAACKMGLDWWDMSGLSIDDFPTWKEFLG